MCRISVIEFFIENVRFEEFKDKRVNVAKIRRVGEEEINRAMNVLVDVDLIFPKTLREAMGLRW